MYLWSMYQAEKNQGGHWGGNSRLEDRGSAFTGLLAIEKAGKEANN